jgi:hypothetical protein
MEDIHVDEIHTEKIYTTPCNHLFHLTCIKQSTLYVDNSLTCPYCRGVLLYKLDDEYKKSITSRPYTIKNNIVYTESCLRLNIRHKFPYTSRIKRTTIKSGKIKYYRSYHFRQLNNKNEYNNMAIEVTTPVNIRNNILKFKAKKSLVTEINKIMKELTDIYGLPYTQLKRNFFTGKVSVNILLKSERVKLYDGETVSIIIVPALLRGNCNYFPKVILNLVDFYVR